jgi:hypothetical protein
MYARTHADERVGASRRMILMMTAPACEVYTVVLDVQLMSIGGRKGREGEGV